MLQVSALVHWPYCIILEAGPMRNPSGDSGRGDPLAFNLKRPEIRDSWPEVFRRRLE